MSQGKNTYYAQNFAGFKLKGFFLQWNSLGTLKQVSSALNIPSVTYYAFKLYNQQLSNQINRDQACQNLNFTHLWLHSPGCDFANSFLGGELKQIVLDL